MSKYLMEFTRQKANALLEYDEQGNLISYQLTPGEFEQAHFIFLLERFPICYKVLQEWKTSKIANVTIKEVQPDLSFQAFYDAYAYKVSKRATAERIWNKMSDTNKAKAIAFIPRYEAHLIKTNVNKKYPETYLNSEMWNN